VSFSSVVGEFMFFKSCHVMIFLAVAVSSCSKVERTRNSNVLLTNPGAVHPLFVCTQLNGDMEYEANFKEKTFRWIQADETKRNDSFEQMTRESSRGIVVYQMFTDKDFETIVVSGNPARNEGWKGEHSVLGSSNELSCTKIEGSHSGIPATNPSPIVVPHPSLTPPPDLKPDGGSSYACARYDRNSPFGNWTLSACKDDIPFVACQKGSPAGEMSLFDNVSKAMEVEFLAAEGSCEGSVPKELTDKEMKSTK
jgi:hypothetical protein